MLSNCTDSLQVGMARLTTQPGGLGSVFADSRSVTRAGRVANYCTMRQYDDDSAPPFSVELFNTQAGN